MKRLNALLFFVYDFLIGDDWKIAAGVVAGLGVSALLVNTVSHSIWWVLPLAVVVTLATSLYSAVSRK